MPDTKVKFRGQDTCVQRLYLTVTRAPFGVGKRTSLGAMLRNPNLTKQGRLEFSTPAMVQAFKALEDRGFVAYDHQKNDEPGPLNRVYRVLVDFDPDLVPAGAVRRSPVRHETVVETPEVTTTSDSDLESRVASLEATVASLINALRAV